MDKFTALLEEFIIKAVTTTEDFLARDVDFEKLDLFTANRERLFQVIAQISNQVDWTTVPTDKKDELSRQIDYVKKLDEKLLVKLQEAQAEIKLEIESTHRSKENIKGYNLNDTK